MDPKTPGEAPFKLELVDDSPRSVTATVAPPAEPAPPPPPPPPAAHDSDRFLSRATREREEGVVDAALWSRALSLAEGDEAAAVGPYLRARATVLKLAHDRALADVTRAAPAAAPDRAPVATPAAPAPGTRRRPLLFALGAVGVVVLGAIAWMLLAPGAEPAPAASVPTQSEQSARVAAAAVVPSPAAPVVDPIAELRDKVASLRAAGNWNVHVLYAAELTRKQPNDAAAWYELAGGYLKLGQVDEAFEAAKKAVALEASRAAYHRELAAIYVVLERPDDALASVEQALALDAADVDTLALAGTLYLKLARLPEARSAFDKVLAVDPANRASTCGAQEVAQKQGRRQDADALGKAMKAAGIECVAASQVAQAPVPPAKGRASR
jgi:cytochrome c-type biogenesis protein CcmH/NrfG